MNLLISSRKFFSIPSKTILKATMSRPCLSIGIYLADLFGDLNKSFNHVQIL